MTNYIIRALKITDEPELLALVREEMVQLERMDARFKLRPDAMTRYANYLRERIREMDSAVFVAEFEGRAIGLGIASIRQNVSFFEPSRFGTISDLVVSPEMRRQGVGSGLVERMRKWFRSLGVDVIRLYVASENLPAREFWKSESAKDYLVETWIPVDRAAGALASAERAEEGAAAAAARSDEDAAVPSARPTKLEPDSIPVVAAPRSTAGFDSAAQRAIPPVPGGSVWPDDLAGAI